MEEDTTAQHHQPQTTSEEMDANSTDDSVEDTDTTTNEPANPASFTNDVNGGIADDDLIHMMASEAQGIYSHITEDQAPSGPVGNNEQK